MGTGSTVFLIDDDDAVRDALGWLLRTRRLLSTPFDSADRFWAQAQQWPDGPQDPCCAVLDLRMPGMSGLALFEHLRTLHWFETMPIIFLSGHADLPTAVDAVLRGAFDFCEKPFSNNALVERVERALDKSARVLAERHRCQALRQRIADLTEREQAVMRLMMEGLPNKLIADQLQISIRTVEVHRARVLDKMNARTVVDLVNLLNKTGQR
ncbi:response regulator [Rhodoferax sp.]|uniref:response regulator transcription factor n=1 Tax=Rhodoferax sp. TaxID=50421 RepID=UPI00263793ED|nr:response regulator [Rhodoferax sp.]MDD2924323.1 response regulator [Rhodoferax sp.]